VPFTLIAGQGLRPIKRAESCAGGTKTEKRWDRSQRFLFSSRPSGWPRCPRAKGQHLPWRWRSQSCASTRDTPSLDPAAASPKGCL